MQGLLERRTAALAIRARGRRLEGHAAVFNSPTQIGPVTESIAPGAFRAALSDGRDVLALVDHDPSQLLARTRSGTLKLSEDSRGLAFEIDLPATTLGADILALVERGDVGGMSFGFRMRPDGESWSGKSRTLQAIDLREVSVIHSFAAYANTSVSARGASQPVRLALARHRLKIAEAGE